MAKRIFFSLLQHLVPEQERAARMATTGNAIDYKALESLVYGAKEVVKYGTKACEDECDHYKGAVVEDSFTKSNIKRNLEIAIEMFNDDGDGDNDGFGFGWETQHGGETWAQIAKTLLSIHNYLTKAEKEKASYEWEEYHKTLMEMAVELNFLDQLMHNTGSIFNKMLDLEFRDNAYNEKDDENNRKRKQDVRRLMHSKELTDPYHVLNEVLPHVEKDPGNFRPWIVPGKNILKKNINEKTKNDVNNQIRLIAFRKEAESLYKKTDIAHIKKILVNDTLNFQQLTQILYNNISKIRSFIVNNIDSMTDENTTMPSECKNILGIYNNIEFEKSKLINGMLDIISNFESLIDNIYK